MHRRRPVATSLLACALALAACGTRVDPEVFDELTAGGSGAATTGAAGGTNGGVSAGTGTAGPDPGGVTVAREGDASPGGSAEASGPGGGADPSDGSGGPTDDASGGRDADGGSGGGPGAAGPGSGNRASDTGVTADRILVGNITTKGGPLGPYQFTPMVQGAQAFFARLNADGGVNGRRVELISCDDKADPDRNRQCARDLIEDQGVFALVANSTRAYAGADYVSAQGVPDVGGQPVGNQYFRWPTLFAIRGAEYPRDGEVGYRGSLYNGTAIFHHLRRKLSLGNAAVFYYDIPQSAAYGRFQAEALRTEGYQVVEYQVNPALPSFDSYVADMEARGVDSIYDAMDLTGNQNLCRSMQRNDFAVKAKVTLVASWSRRVEQQFPEICKRSMYAWGETIPYTADVEGVQRFRQAMSDVYGGELDDSLHIWHLEGWNAAMLFTQGVRSMGAEVTREGLLAWLDGFTTDRGFGADGLMVPQSWQPIPYDEQGTTRECISVARWSLQAADFLPVEEGYPVCYDVPWVGYAPPPN